MSQHCPRCGRFASSLIGLNGDQMCDTCFERAMKSLGVSIREISKSLKRLSAQGIGVQIELDP